jgi:hypothetical protein
MADLMVMAGTLIQEMMDIMARCPHCREEYAAREAATKERGDMQTYWDWNKQNRGRCIA